MIGTKTCKKCLENKPYELFDYVRNSGQQRRAALCRECTLERQRKWARDNVNTPGLRERRLERTRAFKAESYAYVNGYKAAKGCFYCGEADPVVLDFHHLNGTEKEASVSILINRHSSREKIDAEIKKCVVVCANDHRRIHAGTL